MKNKLFNFLFRIMFGFVSYAVISVFGVVMQQIKSCFLICFIFVLLFAYGLVSVCIFKSTFPERLIRVAAKPIALIAFSLILWPVRNKIYGHLGVNLSDNPVDGLMTIMLLAALPSGRSSGF